MNIMISGGHLTPALAVIDYIQENDLLDGGKILFVGRIFSQDLLQQKALEEEEIKKRKALFPKKSLQFIPFQATRFVNSSFQEKIRSFFHFFQSFLQAYSIVKREKPDVFLSFGGYLAVPIAVACWLQKIPVITHEQTRASGMANRVIAVFAKKVAISYEESRGDFPQHKGVLTGNPVRKKVLASQPERPEWFLPRVTKPILLIMGGNQGSKALNQAVAQSLDTILSEWTLVHQCGKGTSERNTFEWLRNKRENLEEEKNLEKPEISVLFTCYLNPCRAGKFLYEYTHTYR